MSKYFWILLSILFFGYGVYDLIIFFSSNDLQKLGTFELLSNLVVAFYIIGSSVFIFYIKIIKDNKK